MSAEREVFQQWETRLSAYASEIETEKPYPAPATYVPVSDPGGIYVKPAGDPDKPSEIAPGWSSLGNDPELFEEQLFLQASLHREEVEAAITEWSRSGERPPLQGDARFCLLFRLNLGRQAVELLVNYGHSPILPPWPDPADWGRFLAWTLIDVWNALGERFLKGWAEDARRKMVT